MDRQLGNLNIKVRDQRLEINKQQTEIKELKEETERLRAALRILFVTKPEAPQIKPFLFLELPAELRETIYELCLVKGTVYLRPRAEYDHRYNGIGPFENPSWALLGVNRQIRDEAARILLTKNHFVLSYDKSAAEKFWSVWATGYAPRLGRLYGHPPLRSPIRKLTTLVKAHVQSVSITMDMRTISTNVLKIASFGQDPDVDQTHFSTKDRVMHAHSNFAEFTPDWAGMCKFLMSIKAVEINVANTYCPLGCHRYIDVVAESIETAIKLMRVPEKLVILGTKKASEREIFRSAITAGLLHLSTRPNGHGYDGVLSFKSTPCLRSCLDIHGYEADELDDEEISFKALMEAGQDDSMEAEKQDAERA